MSIIPIALTSCPDTPFTFISAPEVAFPSLFPEGTVTMSGFPLLA